LRAFRITKPRDPVKWAAYHLYVILNVFSRYVVGWMIAHRESSELAMSTSAPGTIQWILPISTVPAGR